jgi:hypothetical protein
MRLMGFWIGYCNMQLQHHHYLHNSQITTAPAKSFFQRTVSSPAIPWQQLLTVEILQLHILKSSLNDGSLPTASFPHRLSYRTDLVTPIVLLVTPQHGPHRETMFPTVPLLLCINLLLQEAVYWAIAQNWPWYICPSCSCCIALAQHATLLLNCRVKWIHFLQRRLITNSHVK